MKAINIKWKENDQVNINSLPTEVDIPKHLVRHICHKNEIYPDYNFLMGYTTGKPKKWWYGIEGITFIWMGAWSDSYVGYKNYALNAHWAEDTLWDAYNYNFPAPPYNTPEYHYYENEGFTQYMQDNADTVFTLLDYTIEQTENTISNYLIEAFECDHEGFDTSA